MVRNSRRPELGCDLVQKVAEVDDKAIWLGFFLPCALYESVGFLSYCGTASGCSRSGARLYIPFGTIRAQQVLDIF